MAQQQWQQHEQQDPELGTAAAGKGIKFVRLATVGVVVCVTAWAWQVRFGSSEGVVYKPEAVYDFIIVGGGTAGCVLAARLSEEEGYKVLLVEAGGEEPWLASIPLAVPLLQKSSFDWQHFTLPQKFSSEALKERRSAWPRGRVLGGSSTINYNIHMFGSPQDYNVWEKQYGANGWGFNDLLKFANRAECRSLRPKIFKQDQCSSDAQATQKKGCSRGDGGKARPGVEHIRRHQDSVQCYNPPLRTHTANSVLTETFLAAGKELGVPVGNLNDDIDHGVMAGVTTVFNGMRWNTARGFLRPALGRPNLHVLLYTHVTKVVWEGKRAVGVEFIQWDNPRLISTVYARGEVLVCAGTLHTPSILTHSGVGPHTLLEKLKIPEVAAREGVGANLQDHLNLPVYVHISTPVSLNPHKMRSLSNFWQYFVTGGKGDLGRAAIEGVGALQVGGHREGGAEVGQPEVGVILFNMGAVDKHLYSSISNMKLDYFDTMFPGMDNQSAEGFIFLASCLHPKSRGHVVVTSSDPRALPALDPAYLTHPYDRACMRDAFKMAVRLARTKAFTKLGASVHLPRYPECVVGGGGNGSKDTHTKYQDYVDCLSDRDGTAEGSGRLSDANPDLRHSQLRHHRHRGEGSPHDQGTVGQRIGPDQGETVFLLPGLRGNPVGLSLFRSTYFLHLAHFLHHHHSPVGVWGPLPIAPVFLYIYTNMSSFFRLHRLLEVCKHHLQPLLLTGLRTHGWLVCQRLEPCWIPSVN